MLMLLIMQVTIYAIHSEVKDGTSQRWLELANGNFYKALAGKLLPQLMVWIVMGATYLVVLYAYWDFPLKSGLWPMALDSLLLIVVSQAFGVFLCELLPSLRWALSIATQWGVLSFRFQDSRSRNWHFLHLCARCRTCSRCVITP